MNAVLAIIADGGQAIIVIHRKGVEINKYHLNFIKLDHTQPTRPQLTP